MIVAGGSPPMPVTDVAQELNQQLEGVVESGPVLKVDGAAQRVSPRREARAPQAPPQTASLQDSRWWIPCGHEHRQRAGDDQVVEEPRACSSIHFHSPSSIISRSCSERTRAARESITSRRERPKSR